MWVYTAQIVCYLITGRLNEARFCWKRVPQSLLGDTEMQAVQKVVQTLWEKDYAGFHKSIADHPWGELLLPLMPTLADETRSRVERIVSKAYTTISVETLMSMLAYSHEKVLQLASENAWELDTDKQMIRVVDAAASSDSSTRRRGLEQLFRYSQSV